MSFEAQQGPLRLKELLADEACGALDVSGRLELTSLLDGTQSALRDEMLGTAALAQLAFMRRSAQTAQHRPLTLPKNLKHRLVRQGRLLVMSGSVSGSGTRPFEPQARPDTPQDSVSQAAPYATTAQTTGTPNPPPAGMVRAQTWRRTATWGWAIAAGVTLALVIGGPQSPNVSPLKARSVFMAEVQDVLTLPWAPPTEKGYQTVSGNVVWSPSLQQGYLKIANLPVNDPSRKRYQLWIVDKSRAGSAPVDGGVFDIDSTGEVIVPIEAALMVTTPVAFAITLEDKGGVVVSAGPLLVVASI